MAYMRIPTEIRWVWGTNLQGRSIRVKHVWDGDRWHMAGTLCGNEPWRMAEYHKDDPLSSIPICKACKRILDNAFSTVEMLSEKIENGS